MVLGILAHVDAGKTTLSEAILYNSGKIRKLGRVDNQDAFLDTYELEKKRGITIFSKQANVGWKDKEITLLDTPGHVDFSAEMERTLQVLDSAILVVSASDGVQGHTRTLWRLLKRYQIPVFLFINKMDQPDTDKERILGELTQELDAGCVDFSQTDDDSFYENLAVCEEGLLNSFLEKGNMEPEEVRVAIQERKVFPCFFGSALKNEGVEALLEGIALYGPVPAYGENFGAKVYKITRDSQGNRLTHMKVTGGSLKAKDVLTGNSHLRSGDKAECWEEKINQIRIYSGEKFEAVSEVTAGNVCAVTGLSKTVPGEGLGVEKDSETPFLEPVLSYCVQLPEETDAAVMLPKLRQLEEEDPMLQIVWNEKHKEIHAKVMGEVQIEILQSLVKERFGVDVTFGSGTIVYKETIADTVEGVGHFEPLRHYAEVHLLLRPGTPGSGLKFATDCSEDILAKNWQRLILTHLEEKEHLGVLTGSAITDMEIILVTGRAHLKHTEGGDFRQATYRALRQGLMEASGVLLEPVYEFRLEVPQESIGRAMTDMDKMYADFSLEQKSDGSALLTGTAPVVLLQHYQKEVISYTKGNGKLSCLLKGYAPCHNAGEVIEAIGYNADEDLENPASSVFCAHGAGFLVPWEQVKDYMHLPSVLAERQKKQCGTTEVEDVIWEAEIARRKAAAYALTEENKQSSTNEVNTKDWIGTDEIDAIIGRVSHANSKENGGRKKEGWQRSRRNTSSTVHTGMAPEVRVYKGQEKKEAYLLVDGYNIIYAWEDLKELAELNLDGARGKLLDILCNYQGMKKCELIAVFDAYRVQGHPTEVFDYHNIHVVFTKEAETADQYIEKFAHEHAKKYDVTVATSDGLEQIIIRGQGCKLLSARDLKEEIRMMEQKVREEYLQTQKAEKRYLLDEASGEVLSALSEMKNQ